ncbi:hypothetical protein HLB09_15665, partial [Pseudokineococcus marinus]|nr:hypothetical protein [Pseudokineococcus marinus]
MGGALPTCSRAAAPDHRVVRTRPPRGSAAGPPTLGRGRPGRNPRSRNDHDVTRSSDPVAAVVRRRDVRPARSRGAVRRRWHHRGVSSPTSSPTTGPRRVVVLGSTGSIGVQALEVAASAPERFRVLALAAGGSDPALLARQAVAARVEHVAVADERALPALREHLAGLRLRLRQSQHRSGRGLRRRPGHPLRPGRPG